MKKLLILALVALVAGAAFADTDPVFSGSFSAYWAYQTDNALEDDHSWDVAVDLQATIDDFNTVSVSLATADAADTSGFVITAITAAGTKFAAGDTIDYDVDGDGTADATYTVVDDDDYDGEYVVDTAAGDIITEVGADESTDDLLQLQKFNLTTDITGALGVDGPVSVTSEIGKVSLSSVAISDLLYKNGATASDEGAVFTIGIVDMITLKTIVLPAKWTAGDAEFGFTVEAETPVGNAAAYFIRSEGGEDGDDDFDWGNQIDGTDDEYGPYKDFGVSFGTMPIDGLTVMAMFNGMLDIMNTNAFRPAAYQFGLGTQITMVEGFEFTVGFGGTIIPEFNDGANDYAIPLASELTIAISTTVVEGLEANLEVEASGFLGETKVDGTAVPGTDVGFMEVLEIAFDATYALMDNLSVFGAVKGKYWEGMTGLKYDAGIATGLGALDVVIGCSNSLDFKAPEDDFYYASPYVSVSTSFSPD